MQPVWLCILWSKQFEDTFENQQWRKPNKCYQCDFAYSQASNLRTHLKHTVEKNQTNATNATMRPLIWGNIWKHTVVKNQTNVTYATLHSLRQAIWGDIWKHTVWKSETFQNTQFHAQMIIDFFWSKPTLKNYRWPYSCT